MSDMWMLDAAPLLEAVDRRCGTTCLLHDVGLTGNSEVGKRWRDALRRVRRNGHVSPWLADRICVRLLGTLPELIYGEAFFAGCDETEAA